MWANEQSEQLNSLITIPALQRGGRLQAPAAGHSEVQDPAMQIWHPASLRCSRHKRRSSHLIVLCMVPKGLHRSMSRKGMRNLRGIGPGPG